jgi:hypothetical protein
MRLAALVCACSAACAPTPDVNTIRTRKALMAADALARLRQFESLIDTITGAKQWARPARFR